jgi:hypothetical protein
MFARSALIVYSLAPKELSPSSEKGENAHHYLEALWNVCESLGMSQPVPGLDHPTIFPRTLDVDNSSFRIVAAKVDLERRKERSDYQAFLFEYQDMFGLVATLETSGQAADLSQWQKLLAEWNQCLGNVALPAGLMQETYLFTALGDADAIASSDMWLSDEHFSSLSASRLGSEVIRALPGSGETQGLAGPSYLTDTGYYIWEGKPLARRQMLALITSETKKDDLFAWAVWPDPHTLAPFARYLVHRAKLHFAEKVFKRDVSKLSKQSRPLEEALNDLISLCRRSEEDESWNLKEIIKAHNVLIEGHIRSFDLLRGISRLKELLLTTRIAARNIHRLTPGKASRLSRSEGSIFDQDRARAAWLREQLQMDLGYLAALRERVREGHKMAALLLDRESEKTERRSSNLVFLQVTLLGSITIGLLLLPAFEVFEHHHSLVWFVGAFLVTIALALPRLFARWHEDYTRWDNIAGGLLGAAGLSLGLAIWPLLLPVIHVSSLTYNISSACVAICGFLSGYLSVAQMEKLRPKPSLGLLRNGARKPKAHLSD